MSAPVWSAATAIAPRTPQSPYAHFAWHEASLDRRTAGTARAIYEPARACVCFRHRSGEGMRVEVTETLLEDIGPLDDAVGIQLPREVVNPKLGDVADPAVPGTKDAGGDAWFPPPDEAGSPVFIGIVDDAISFAHQRFRLGNGETRFDYLWLQGVPFQGGTVPFGREFGRPAINALFGCGGDRARLRGEAAIYRDPEVGLIDMRRQELQHAALARSHGAAVLDVAAGYMPGDPRGARRPILAVCLPPEVTRDTLGTFAEAYVVLGLQRLLAHLEARRRQLGWRVPAVINISLALGGGPKDGTGLLDRYLAELETTHDPIAFVLPAGNHRLTRSHARFEAFSGGPHAVTWRLPPDDLTPSFLEVWGPRRAEPAAPALRVGLTLPGASRASVLPELAFGTYRRLSLGADRDVAWAYCHWVGGPGGEGRERVTIVAFPTVPSGNLRAAPAGDWRVSIDAGPDEVEVFVQRDDTISGFRPRGRQSRLVDDGYALREPNGRFRVTDAGETSPIRRAGTISSFATGAIQIVVGGHYGDTGQEVEYSGAPLPGGRPVTVFGTAERSRVRGGVLAAGTASGARVAIAGTSLAAAAVTRETSDAMAGP